MKQYKLHVTWMVITVGILSAQELKNVQVLPFETKKDLMVYMKTKVAKSLGVKCNFCHNIKDYSSDEKAHKTIGREMMKMVMDINENVMVPIKFDPISCWTCHRGDESPERDIADTKEKK
ncbi:MAG: c-type cytochrome, partial [Candidatus Marinimicrobia bacterium]|nr:c-type cytochrome [Candidatus Neomarinimicrobiota bacterium]